MKLRSSGAASTFAQRAAQLLSLKRDYFWILGEVVDHQLLYQEMGNTVCSLTKNTLKKIFLFAHVGEANSQHVFFFNGGKINIKCYHPNQLQVCSSMSLSTFTRLCNCHLIIPRMLSASPTETWHPSNTNSPSSPPHTQPGNFYSLPLWILHVSGTIHICTVCLAYFTYNNVLKVHPRCSRCQSILPFWS